MDVSVLVLGKAGVVVLDLVGQGHFEGEEGAFGDGRLYTLRPETVRGHDLGVGGFPTEVLDNVEVTLEHLDDGAPPTAGFLLRGSAVNFDLFVFSEFGRSVIGSTTLWG